MAHACEQAILDDHLPILRLRTISVPHCRQRLTSIGFLFLPAARPLMAHEGPQNFRRDHAGKPAVIGFLNNMPQCRHGFSWIAASRRIDCVSVQCCKQTDESHCRTAWDDAISHAAKSVDPIVQSGFDHPTGIFISHSTKFAFNFF